LWKAYQAKNFYIVKPKATCHITRQASINARASVWYPIKTVKQAALSARDKSFHVKFDQNLAEMSVKNDASGGVED